MWWPCHEGVVFAERPVAAEMPPEGPRMIWSDGFIVGGKPMPGKTFSTDPQGKAMMEDQIPAVAMNSPVFAVTLEPKNGVPSPTGDMYLRSGS